MECQPLGVPGSNRTHDKVPKAVQKALPVGSAFYISVCVQRVQGRVGGDGGLRKLLVEHIVYMGEHPLLVVLDIVVT